MISEEILYKATNEAMLIMIDSLPSKEEFSHTFSKRFIKKIKHVRTKADHPHLQYAIKYIASFFFIILLGLAPLLTFNTEARSKIWGWIFEHYETFSSYSSQNQSTSVATLDFIPTYIPSNYQIHSTLGDNTFKTIIYKNSNNQYLKISYMDKSCQGTLYIDTTSSHHYVLNVNNYNADFYYFADNSTANELIWIDEQYDVLFAISGFHDSEFLIRIAESIVFQESD